MKQALGSAGAGLGFGAGGTSGEGRSMAALDGTVALVTGASSGIGRATARRLAAEAQTAAIEPLHPDDIADVVAWIVTRDRRVAVNEVLVRAAEQTW